MVWVLQEEPVCALRSTRLQRRQGGEKTEWEQLINCGINRNTFSESWKIFASKVLFDHC